MRVVCYEHKALEWINISVMLCLVCDVHFHRFDWSVFLSGAILLFDFKRRDCVSFICLQNNSLTLRASCGLFYFLIVGWISTSILRSLALSDADSFLIAFGFLVQCNFMLQPRLKAYGNSLNVQSLVVYYVLITSGLCFQARHYRWKGF